MTTPRLEKPQLRGLLVVNIKRNLATMGIFAVFYCAAYQYFYAQPRKQAYADFYKTYDPMAALKIMEDAGLMQSCPK